MIFRKSHQILPASCTDFPGENGNLGIIGAILLNFGMSTILRGYHHEVSIPKSASSFPRDIINLSKSEVGTSFAANYSSIIKAAISGKRHRSLQAGLKKIFSATLSWLVHNRFSQGLGPAVAGCIGWVGLLHSTSWQSDMHKKLTGYMNSKNFKFCTNTGITVSTILAVCLAVLSTMVSLSGPWLGMEFDRTYDGEGVRILHIANDSPAAAKLVAGDIIAAVQTPALGRVEFCFSGALEDPDRWKAMQDTTTFLHSSSRYGRSFAPSFTAILKDGRSIELPPQSTLRRPVCRPRSGADLLGGPSFYPRAEFMVHAQE